MNEALGGGSLEALRQANRLRVIDALRRHGNVSRGELMAITGLSRTTITTLLGDLQERGMVVASDAEPRPEPAGRGRPAARLRLAPAAGAALGIDFGHRHLRVAVADLSS